MKKKIDEYYYNQMETSNIFLSSYQNNILVRSIINGINSSFIDVDSVKITSEEK